MQTSAPGDQPAATSPPSLTSQVSDRTTHLSRLADAVRSRGGTALLALSATAHPVLYVRTGGHTLPVVAMPVNGEWWLIWGRPGQAPAAHVEGAAAALCPAHPAPVAARRAAWKGAA